MFGFLHIAGSLRKLNFEIIRLGIEPNSYFFGHRSSPAFGLKLDRLIYLTALGTAGTVHVGVISVNVAAFFTPEQAVFARLRLKAPPAELGINGDSHQRRQQSDHV